MEYRSEAVISYMPRQPRIDIPGTLYHVMVRGIERRKLFCDDKDRQNILRRLGNLVRECRVECYAWALLPNHFHLLLKPLQTSLSAFMQRLLTGYAVNFNYRYKRSGHLFQNRYKAIICQKEAYLLQLVRYIHLNSLRAGLVTSLNELDEYPWSGHAVLMRKEERDWQNTDEILRRFGRTAAVAKKKYREFVKLTEKEGSNPVFQGGGLRRSAAGWEMATHQEENGKTWQSDERILGENGFVLEILKEVEARGQKQEKRKREGWTLAKIAGEVCCHYSLNIGLIKRRCRKTDGAVARAIIAYLGKHELGCSVKEIAVFLRITQPGASKLIARGKGEIRESGLKFLIHERPHFEGCTVS